MIQHNLLAQNANRMQKITNGKLAKSTKKLSSGYKINSAADDAAHLSISEKMRLQIRGLNRGAANIGEGVGYCQTADGALAEVEDMLQRVNELAIQAANGTNSESDRLSIDEEVQQLKAEISRICVTTRYNEDYIFKCEEEDEIEQEKEKYRLSFYGIPEDLFVYNDSYNPVDHTATYGGIAYQGKRYAWASIDPNMYDTVTGEFRDGTYTLHADDGTYYTLISKAGTTPPTLDREYRTEVNSSGIFIGEEWISWEDVKTKTGDSFDPDDIWDQEYHFNYRGIDVSFKPDLDDTFDDVINRLNGTIWRSQNQIPTEQTALYADFSRSMMGFQSEQQVKDFLDHQPIDLGVKLRAGDGTNGAFDGVWIEQNGVELAGSRKSWADLGITNWGDQSQDIWEDKRYEYTYEMNGRKTIQYTFQMINETSKASVIQALDNVDLLAANSSYLDNGMAVDFNPTDSHLIGLEEKYDNVNLTLATEYYLGRDYTQAADTFASAQLTLSGNKFGVSYTNTKDGTTVTDGFENSSYATDSVVNNIKRQIKDAYNEQIAVVKARYLAGVTNPQDISLSAVIGSSNITGNGSSTYLQDTFTMDSADPAWKSTQTTAGSQEFACASIDFSGLGTAYDLMDLIGTGFNATCATCSNHYSVQFVTNQSMQGNVTWLTDQIDGKDYRFSKVDNGVDHTLYIDLASMQQNGIANGIQLTNTLVDIISASRYAFHFNQYATGANDAKLVLLDNRDYFVENGVSIAQNATFAPVAYDSNSVVDFDIMMNSSKGSGNFTLHYQYDFSNLFDNIKATVNINPNGDYVYDAGSQRYVPYEPTNPAHTAPGVPRYDVTDVTLDTQGMDFDTYIEQFVRNNILQSVADSTKVNLTSDFSGMWLQGHAMDNEAMVTNQSTPYQLLPQQKAEEPELVKSLKIQCSSNTRDALYMTRQKLSLSRLGIRRCNTLTESAANKAIRMAGAALQKVNEVRSLFGAYQNRLEHALNINQNTGENTQSAESQMRDTDMAKEMMEYSSLSIIQQAGQSMLAQANHNPNRILGLLK